MKTEVSRYCPGGGVIVSQDPPVKCRITGQSSSGGNGGGWQVAVGLSPPPTAQTSPLDTMKSEKRSFVVPIATPFVHMNPFQWNIVGSGAKYLPTAQPSFGSIGAKGGPKEMDMSSESVGLVTVPQLVPSKCRITPLLPTAQPSLALLE
jgi:hypothetical protein